ncbi:DUF1289 domain-containing protein [Novosphingobium sp. FKTRR1]|uniref:DUF1289 domain-containing protein n=1 Tax=Novosphingobium sp. FKTRR1 TaxID=2879118 RepID=UPI001CF04D59|nr:DUF1289 domain-containing protein [Novosphingobium sp. FKTRR1]
MSDEAASEPVSPCTGVCTIDPVARTCLGCARTLAEIERWFGATRAERQAILRAVAGRKALADAAGGG